MVWKDFNKACWERRGKAKDWKIFKDQITNCSEKLDTGRKRFSTKYMSAGLTFCPGIFTSYRTVPGELPKTLMLRFNFWALLSSFKSNQRNKIWVVRIFENEGKE
ncbi:hypothetical protein QQP08_027090 [Theobroma cacao]|uniref:Uncharacterized protein n=1 Tax=Theobroma cacao TaxID=3641 RepID=A0A061GK76_THECC|nr:Uncharacterized protein TCM_037523 [Theobroma cacao]WRX34603.1 hypothetical protein QQP08_027090 [Theobroma cacao]